MCIKIRSENKDEVKEGEIPLFYFILLLFCFALFCFLEMRKIFGAGDVVRNAECQILRAFS